MTQTTLSSLPADLLNNLADPAAKVRRLAMTSLRENYPSQALQPLCGLLLTDPLLTARAQAAQELGKLKDKGAVGPLIQSLQDPGLSVRTRALKALGLLKADSAVAPIIVLLTDPSEAVQLAAIRALRALRHPRATPALLALLPQAREQKLLEILYALGAIGDPSAVPALLAKIQPSLSASMAWQVMQTLGRIGSDAAIDRLVEFAVDWPVQSVRAQRAISTLGQIGGSRALSVLLDLYQSTEDSTLRLMVFDALALVKHAEGEPKAQATEILLQALEAQDSSVPAAVATALGGTFKDERALRPLLKLLQSLPMNNYRLRLSITRALAEIGGSVVVDETARLYRQTQDKQLRSHILFIWQDLKGFKAVEKEEMLDILLRTCREPDHHLRSYAIVILSKRFKKEKRVVDLFLELLQSSETALVTTIAWALGNMGEKRAIEPLLRLLKQKGYNYHQVLALRSMKDARVVEYLLSVLDPTIAVFDDKQRLYIQVLGNLKDARAIAPISTFLQRSDTHYQYIARQALANLHK